MTDIDLCVNCYERTYRDVLTPGFFTKIAREHGDGFSRRTAVINNVHDRLDAERRARVAHETGELDAWFFVEDHIEQALDRTGLAAADIARAPYFTDWGIVLVTVSGPDWFVHCDAEVTLRHPVDWVTPSIDLMQRDRRLLVANPSWHTPAPRHDTLDRETLERTGEFAIGLGFSDQLFLARRAELAAPIYLERCVASRRYPMAHVTRSFEARIDSWMRHHQRMRANFLGATYVHPDEIGGAYPRRTTAEKVSAVLNRAIVTAVEHAPLRPHCCRVI